MLAGTAYFFDPPLGTPPGAAGDDSAMSTVGPQFVTEVDLHPSMDPFDVEDPEIRVRGGAGSVAGLNDPDPDTAIDRESRLQVSGLSVLPGSTLITPGRDLRIGGAADLDARFDPATIPDAAEVGDALEAARALDSSIGSIDSLDAGGSTEDITPLLDGGFSGNAFLGSGTIARSPQGPVNPLTLSTSEAIDESVVDAVLPLLDATHGINAESVVIVSASGGATIAVVAGSASRTVQVRRNQKNDVVLKSTDEFQGGVEVVAFEHSAGIQVGATEVGLGAEASVGAGLKLVIEKKTGFDLNKPGETQALLDEFGDAVTFGSADTAVSGLGAALDSRDPHLLGIEVQLGVTVGGTLEVAAGEEEGRLIGGSFSGEILFGAEVSFEGGQTQVAPSVEFAGDVGSGLLGLDVSVEGSVKVSQPIDAGTGSAGDVQIEIEVNAKTQGQIDAITRKFGEGAGIAGGAEVGATIAAGGGVQHKITITVKNGSEVLGNAGFAAFQQQTDVVADLGRSIQSGDPGTIARSLAAQGDPNVIAGRGAAVVGNMIQTFEGDVKVETKTTGKVGLGANGKVGAAGAALGLSGNASVAAGEIHTRNP